MEDYQQEKKHDGRLNLPDSTGLAKAPAAAEMMRAKIVGEARIVKSEYVDDSMRLG
jgi:hypothetical protein